MLYDSLKIYAKISHFCIAYNGKGKIHYNCSYDNKKENESKTGDYLVMFHCSVVANFTSSEVHLNTQYQNMLLR